MTLEGMDDSGPRVRRSDMTFAEKPRPVAYCAGCNMPSLSERAVGMSCTKADCGGTYRSAVGADDWTKCAACDGSGLVGTAYCGNCHASGWELTRHVRPR